MKSPNNDLEDDYEPESIIDRNLNLIPHFKTFETEKRKLMIALTNQ